MKFSIITICYNEEKRIQGTLESVYKQVFKDYEHIIEDGCSTDGTLSIVSENAKYYEEDQLRIFSEPDTGLYDAMNRALSRAKGEYICFINSGDFLFDANTLQKVNKEIEESGHEDIYHGISISVFPNMDEYGQGSSSIDSIKTYDMKAVETGYPGLTHQALFAHKRCFENNIFDIRFKLRAEYRWYYKCFQNGYSFVKLNFPVCKYTFGGLSERVESIKIAYEEKKCVLEEFGYSTEQFEHLVHIQDGHCVKNNLIYNQWLALLQAGRSIKKYFHHYKMQTIAVYGYAEYGSHLINELKNTDIKIAYLIDKRELYPYSGIPVYHPDDKLMSVDAIVVTAVLSYKEVKNQLSQKITCPIISLEDILEELWLI